MYRSAGTAAASSTPSSSIGRRDSVDLFLFFNFSEVWDIRTNLAFCSATWAVRASSFDSQEGMLSVRCVKLSRGVTDLDMSAMCLADVYGVGIGGGRGQLVYREFVDIVKSSKCRLVVGHEVEQEKV